MSVLDAMDEPAAREALRRCCGAEAWVDGMLARRPLGDDVPTAAAQVWAALGPDDWREAFTHHPRIGADLAQLRERFRDTFDLSSSEQRGAVGADPAVLERLRDVNISYEQRFGYIFIVCATGKSADEMLALLEQRMEHAPEDELPIAAAQQLEITLIRLRALEESE